MKSEYYNKRNELCCLSQFYLAMSYGGCKVSKLTNSKLKLMKFILMVSFCLFCLFSKGQGIEKALPLPNALSPNAASLGRFGEIPVSLYSGVPRINVPLYEIKIGDFRLPISLDYHASGIKVGDVASNVGLGWVLNAGGIINRRQNGIMDEAMIARYDTYSQQIAQMASSETNDDTKKAIASSWFSPYPNSKYDTEPDIFTFNFAGHTGQFYLNPEGKVTMLPIDNRFEVRYEDQYPIPNRNHVYAFARWIIKDTDGIEYVFGRTKDGMSDNFERSCMSGGNQLCDDNSCVNSWFLSQIILANGQKVDFKYDVTDYTVSIGGYASNYGPNPVYLSGYYEEKQVNYQRILRLREIICADSKLVFSQGALRKDIPNDFTLGKLEIFANVATIGTPVYELRNAYRFFYNYSGRLKLLGLEKYSLEDGSYIPSHTFNYNPIELPLFYYSASQDLWGYYNHIDNRSLVPAMINLPFPTGQGNSVPGAIRAIDPDFTQAGMLTEITYATGGKTQFEYENNTAVCNGVTTSYSLCSYLDNTPRYPWKFINISLIQAENLGSAAYTEVYSGDVTVDTSTMFSFKDRFMSYDGATCSPYVNGDSRIYSCVTFDLQKKQLDNSYVTVAGDFYFGVEYPVGKGTYRVRMKWKNNDRGMFYVSVEYGLEKKHAQVNESKGEILVGGLRVRSIYNIDPVLRDTLKREFNYNYDVSDPSGMRGVTTGIPMNIPVYIHDSPVCTNYGLVKPFTVSSLPVASILSGDGVSVGYAKVSEILSGNNATNGKTDTYFITANDHSDKNILSSALFPFPNAESYHWRRGKENRKIDYLLKDGEYIAVKLTDYKYSYQTSTSVNFKEYLATKIYPNPIGATDFPGSGVECFESGRYVQYNLPTESYILSEVIEREFGNNGIISTTAAYVQHDKTLLPKMAKKSSSHAEEIYSVTKYPVDYSLTNATLSNESQGIKLLLSKNKQTMPIEETIIKKALDGTEYVIGSRLNIFFQDKPLLNKVYELGGHSPLLKSNFTFSYIDNNGNLIKDSRYVDPLVSISQYDQYFNPVEVIERGGKNTVFLWGYNGQYPLAEIKNASYMEVETLLTKTTIDALNAVLVSDGAITAAINKLRTGLPNAMVTSYTYKPLVGMTSKTDPRGIKETYTYDGMQRLKAILDQVGNVTKAIDYHYRFN